MDFILVYWRLIVVFVVLQVIMIKVTKIPSEAWDKWNPNALERELKSQEKTRKWWGFFWIPCIIFVLGGGIEGWFYGR